MPDGTWTGASSDYTDGGNWSSTPNVPGNSDTATFDLTGLSRVVAIEGTPVSVGGWTFAGGDYTGVIRVGPGKKPMNVLLDTGSSALALDGKKYSPDFDHGDKSTHLAQTDSYGDGSFFTGAVIKSTISVGDGPATAELAGGNVAIAYDASENMFGQTDGID